MQIVWYAAAFASFTALSFIAAMLGIGGGTLFTPLQVLFGVGMHQAATTSLFLTVLLSISATYVYRGAGRIDWRLAMAMGAASAAGGFSGGFTAEFLSNRALVLLLAASLALAGASMMHPGLGIHRRISCGEGRHIWRREVRDERYAVNLAVVLPLSFLAGALAGLVGIGGGVVMVPIMVLLSGVPMDIAVATSSVLVGVTAIFGLAGHLAGGTWNWDAGLVFALGVVPGAWLGARTMLRVDKRRLRIGFGIFMFVIASVLVLKSSLG